MLMDLLKQKAFFEESMDLNSSVQRNPSIANGLIQGGSVSMRSSAMSVPDSTFSLMNHKSTVELIQAIYKQMEIIN